MLRSWKHSLVESFRQFLFSANAPNPSIISLYVESRDAIFRRSKREFSKRQKNNCTDREKCKRACSLEFFRHSYITPVFQFHSSTTHAIIRTHIYNCTYSPTRTEHAYRRVYKLTSQRVSKRGENRRSAQFLVVTDGERFLTPGFSDPEERSGARESRGSAPTPRGGHASSALLFVSRLFYLFF